MTGSLNENTCFPFDTGVTILKTFIDKHITVN